MNELEKLLSNDRWLKRPLTWGIFMALAFGILSAAAMRLLNISNVGDWSMLIALLAFVGFTTLHSRWWYENVGRVVARLSPTTQGWHTQRETPPPESSPPATPAVDDYAKDAHHVALVSGHPSYPQGVFIEFGISQDDLIRVARKLLETKWRFTHAELAGKEAGKPLTRDQYEAFRHVCEKAGIVYRRMQENHRSGYVVSDAGKAFFKHYASLKLPNELTSPSLSEGGGQVEGIREGRIHTQAQT